MTEEFVDSLSELLNSINQQNYEQERCKARLTEATSKLNKLQEQLHLQMKEATTLVKLDMPQAAWVAFGIKAKR
jgi:cell shape-determining protein MreC